MTSYRVSLRSSEVALKGKRSISLSLLSGSPTGAMKASFTKGKATVYKIPRTDLGLYEKEAELSCDGIYLLFGKDDKPFVYVGSDGSVIKRVCHTHSFEKGGMYWTLSVLIIPEKGLFTEQKLLYVAHDIAEAIKRRGSYKVLTGGALRKPTVSRLDRMTLDEILADAKTLVSSLGFDVFLPLPSDCADGEGYFYEKNSVKARGRVMADGFWLLKGTSILPFVSDFSNKGIRALRDLHSSEIGRDQKLSSDILFDSPSEALSFAVGKGVNGLDSWIDKDGKTLRENDMLLSRSAKLLTSTERAFILDGPNGKAKGRVVEGGFIVLKGSVFADEPSGKIPDGVRKLREGLIQKGDVRKGTFKKDCLFKSATQAASVVLGKDAKGPLLWHDQIGRTLKEYQA